MEDLRGGKTAENSNSKLHLQELNGGYYSSGQCAKLYGIPLYELEMRDPHNGLL